MRETEFGRTSLNRMGTDAQVRASYWIVLMLICGAAQGATSISSIGVLPNGGSSSATSVNWDGTSVAGTSATLVSGVPVGRAVRWTKAGGLVNLGAPASAESSFARTISGNGLIVGGQYSVPAGETYSYFGMRWSSSTGVQSLRQSSPFVLQSSLNGLSRDGTVGAGTMGTTSLAKQAARWTSSGGYQSLGSLAPSRASEAFGISADGAKIVGVAEEPANGNSAFKWSADTGMQRLTSLGAGLFAQANGISADGEITVGDSSAGAGLQRAVRWDAAGNIQNLGVLPGFTSSFAVGVNINGSMVVGNCTGAGLPSTPFLWTPSSGMVDLASLLASKGLDLTGWNLGQVTGISADGGTIVGGGYFNGAARGWVVSDVPAPGAGLAFGTMGLMGLRRRRTR